MIDISRKGIGGPKTPEGKRRVSLNALKHGMDATSEQAMAVLEANIGCSYADVLDQMRAYYKPMDPVEEVLVRRIARASWRMMFAEAAENRYLSRLCDHPAINNVYERIIRNERFIDIHLHRAVFALEHKRRREFENSRNKLNLPPIHEGIQP